MTEENEVDMPNEDKSAILEEYRRQGRAVFERLMGYSRAQAEGVAQVCEEGAEAFCWGSIWSRPAMTDKTRAALALGICAAQSQISGVKESAKLALRAGWSVEEVAEILFHVQCYSGLYPAQDSARVVADVVAGMKPEKVARQPTLRPDRPGLPGPHDNARPMSDLARIGLRVRREVLGGEDIDRWMAQTIDDDFMMMFFDATHEYCFGTVWARAGLDYRTRSMLCLSINASLGHAGAVKRHIRSAVTAGLSMEDIGEVFLLVYAYAGVYCSLNGFMTATEVFADLKKEGVAVREKRTAEDPLL